MTVSRFLYNFTVPTAVLIGAMVISIPLKRIIEYGIEYDDFKRKRLFELEGSPQQELEKCRYSDVFKYRNNQIHSINFDLFLKGKSLEHNISFLKEMEKDMFHSERAGFISDDTKKSVSRVIDNSISALLEE